MLEAWQLDLSPVVVVCLQSLPNQLPGRWAEISWPVTEQAVSFRHPHTHTRDPMNSCLAPLEVTAAAEAPSAACYTVHVGPTVQLSSYTPPPPGMANPRLGFDRVTGPMSLR